MDIYDREHLKEFLVALFGKQANSWQPNEVQSKFLKTIQENKEQYVICLRGAAYNMALEFKMAAQGV